MVKLPISDYVQNYYKEQKIEFTFRQQAHFCWAYHPLLKDKLESLRELLALSDDEELNREIRERVEYEERIFSRFFESTGSGCIYVAYPDDEGEYNIGYFTSAQSAISYGKSNCVKGFRIIKRCPSDQCREERPGDRELDGSYIELSAYDFTSAGEVEWGYSYECEAVFDEEDKGRFENMFLNIKSPFGRGDIVMGPGFDCPMVVYSDHECFEEIYERHKKDTETCIDDTDNCIRTDKIRDDGRIVYDHTDSFNLWKVDAWDDERYWKILCFLSDAIKRGVDLLYLDYLLHEYR